MGWSAFHISIASVLAEAATAFNLGDTGGGFTLSQTQRNYIALGVAALSVTYLLFRSKFRRKPDPLARQPSSPGGSGTGLAQQRAVERQMQQLLVELSDMARQISAQLDTRAAKLELLIKEADEKLAALESVRSLDERRAPAVSMPRLALVDSTSHDSDSPDQIASAPPHPGVDFAAGSQRRNAEPNIAIVPDPRHAEIYALADQGRGPAEIAQRLGRPSGEIELILALRPTGS